MKKMLMLVLMLFCVQFAFASDYTFFVAPAIHNNAYSNVHSFSISVMRPTEIGSGMQTGRLIHSRLNIVIDADNYFPAYMGYLYNSSALRNATLYFAQGNSMSTSESAYTRLFAIDLTDARVQAVNMGMQDGKPVAEVSLDYRTITWRYSSVGITRSATADTQNPR